MFGAGDSSDKQSDTFGSFGNTPRNNSVTRKDESNVAMIVPRGCKIRDEFICPITRELITDPVIAADGHTYDRTAIEQWIHTKRSDGKSGKNQPRPSRPSPKTGQLLEHTILIPNHNLKRLLKDMIREGGESLYYRDESDKTPTAIAPSNTMSMSMSQSQSKVNDESNSLTVELQVEANTPSHTVSNVNVTVTPSAAKGGTASGTEEQPTTTNAIPSQEQPHPTPPVIYVPNEPPPGPLLALVHAKILNCRCLGPPESDWNNRSFHFVQSSSETLLGGRRRPHELTVQNFVQFIDVTVSRRHFEIRFHNGMFQIRDLGSAGGTFVRIPPRYGVPLTEGTMFMLGKHQLVALEYNATEETSQQSGFQIDNYQGIDLIEGFHTAASDSHQEDGENNDTLQVEEASDHTDKSGFEVMEYQDFGNTTSDRKRADDDNNNNNDINQQIDDTIESTDRIRMTAIRPIPPFVPQTTHERSGMRDLHPTNHTNGTSVDSITPLLHLRCFAPEGTPIQNRKYPISRNGATLGRKQSNTISFSHEMLKDSDNEIQQQIVQQQHQYVGIDSSISGEHATIQFNDDTQQLELFDGVKKRGSTNGTWIRLSSIHEESNWFTLDNKSEILIGTVRFQVDIKDAVVEQLV